MSSPPEREFFSYDTFDKISVSVPLSYEDSSSAYLRPNLLAIVEIGMETNRRDCREGERIRDGVAHRDVHWAVLLVFGQHEVEVLINNPGDIVFGSGVIVRVGREQGKAETHAC